MPDENKRRLSDLAYEGLRSTIITAELKPGQPIEEREQMALLGVGRTPLREALQRLAQEDLVLSVPQRGYFVTSTSAADFFHLNEFRIHSEVLACRMAATRIDPGQLDRLADLMDEARDGVASQRMDLEWHLSVDERLHVVIAEASGNAYLAKALSRLYALSLRSLYVARVPVTLIFEEMENFCAIEAALIAHDPDLAEAAMRQHLRLGVVRMVRSTDMPPDPSKAATL